MVGKGARLLAVLATGAALLGITTAPAHAEDVREATASPYAFIGSGDQEAITIENQDWSIPDYTAGRTPAHAGWSIHLSDEKFGAGLPRQDFKAWANVSRPHAFDGANARGFISIMDQNTVDVPFLVFKVGGDGVVCEGFVSFTQPRLFVRQFDGELHEALDLTKPVVAEHVTSADSATDPRRHSVTIEVKRVTTAAQITPYGPFWKYAGRQQMEVDGHEIIMSYQDATGTTKTYRLLAGGRAISC